MAFINKHGNIRIHTHLTQEGKRRLADGDMRIERIAFSDAEVDYSCGSGITYSSILNNITAMPYRKGGVVSMNYDGTAPYPLDPNSVVSITESIGEPVPTIGFYNNVFGNTQLPGYRINHELCLATGYTNTYKTELGPISFNAGTWFGFAPHYYTFSVSGISGTPPAEGLAFIRWIVPGGGIPNDYYGTNIGYYANFYRFSFSADVSMMAVDRSTPRYDANTVSVPTKEQPIYFYPLSGYSQYYGSGTTTVCPIWNMNIHSKVAMIGADEETQFTIYRPSANSGLGIAFPTTIPETTYGSREVAGIVKSFGLDHLPRCGIIHYSNSYSGDVYGDHFMPRETEVDIPHILWHRNGSGINGSSTRGGLKLIDAGSEIFYDTTGNTSYTILKDGIGPTAQVVGRVYYEMKMIVITDQELLTAMDPKNSRNWTCPPLKLELVSTTDNPFIALSGYTGYAKPGKRYYVTYHLQSYPGSGPRQSVPCSYIQKIDGHNDDDGNPMYIKASFPPNSFPFVRTSIPAFSGAGHHVNMVQLLVQEVDVDDDPGELDLNPFKWRVANWQPTWTTANLMGQFYGISRFGDASSLPVMTASFLNSCVFYATEEEYGDTQFFTYLRDANGGSIGQTLGLDRAFWQGDTEMFFGNITTKKVRKSYIRSVRFFIQKDYLNSTTNSTYSSGSTFISEVYLLGGDNKILGIGKPDRPIEKNDTIMIDLSLNSYY